MAWARRTTAASNRCRDRLFDAMQAGPGPARVCLAVLALDQKT
jgi:hypothetical protein